jgi:cytochrome c553
VTARVRSRSPDGPEANGMLTNSRFRRVVLGSLLAAAVTGPVPSSAAQRRTARPEVTLPDGPVRAVILKSCTACHGIDEYGYYALDRPGWDAIIERMKTTPSGVVKGAVISDKEKEVFLDWLVSRFGPDSKPFPREYVPRQLSEAELLTDDQAKGALVETCQSCHGLERIDETRADAEQWRATLIDMLGRGARLAISDIEPLVEWLARNRGINPEN